ncbi:MAG: S1/P1 Nuclease [Bacteroidota bacterium]
MKKYFPPARDFKSLSVKDLLEARELYHVHLAHLENVVATAIGLYRIRNDDPDKNVAAAGDPKKWKQRGDYSPPRTLQNTIVTPWSWPCILVFVDKWVQQSEIVQQNPDQVVPRFLYMPDGRVVPTCVLLAERYTPGLPPLQDLNFPAHLIGGGYPIFTDDQAQQHVGSLGCLVTDGDTVFALTNRHVTGDEGRPIYTSLNGKKVQIGVSATSHTERKAQLGKRLFKDVYPGWQGSRSYVNLDAGLIRIDDLTNWTAQVFGIGELDDLVDMHTESISLDLIGCPVRAFGGASGELKGEIQALFYRYRSVGGFEFVSDMLIGPRNEVSPLKTMPGDSGTLWFFDPKPDESAALKKKEDPARRLRPIALQWGGQTVIDDQGKGKLQFALATFLSTICRELDIDIIPDWNTGHNDYWGKTGHYKIAAKACELIDTKSPAMAKLSKLLMNNVQSIGFTDQSIESGGLKKIDSKQFVPLADVADLVWRTTRPRDESNHFADMDQPGKQDFAGKTLLDLCKDPANVSVDIWNSFYDCLGTDLNHRGALPFRVWQIYQSMVQFVSEGRIAEFICAGGVMSHYVGDACEPLHVSYLHHGRPDHPEEHDVHSVYETNMLDRYSTEMIAAVNAAIKSRKARPSAKGGRGAAIATIELMRTATETLPPMTIIEAFNANKGNQQLPHMWDVLKDDTANCMAAGALCLASLWASAWKEGGGNKIKADQLGPVSQDALKKLYTNSSFLPSYQLKDKEFKKALQP